MSVNPINLTWTEDRIELLKKLWADGESCSEISRALNCGLSRNAVIGKIARLGLSGRAVAARKPDTRTGRVRPDRKLTRALQEKFREPKFRKERFTPRTPAAEFLGIPLLDLEPHHCRYPKGEGRETLFCGQPTFGATSWCAHCLVVVSAPTRPRVSRPYLPTGGQKPAVF